jgi:hypothetical protein
VSKHNPIITLAAKRRSPAARCTILPPQPNEKWFSESRSVLTPPTGVPIPEKGIPARDRTMIAKIKIVFNRFSTDSYLPIARP